LPKEEGGGPSAPSITEIVPDDEELIIQVYAADNGNIASLTVALKSGNIPLKDTSELFKFLRERVAAGGKAPKLKYEIAERLNYQFVIKLLDEGRRAGYDRISPALLTPGGRK
jgi:biopolymer transport protein ExbD